jgi:hypothetical protein
MELKIGDSISREDFDELSKLNGGYTFDGKTYKLNKSFYFQKENNMLKVISTFESRIEEEQTGHAAVHRPERKNYLGYYNNKS